MAQLPIITTVDQTLQLIQTKWASLINPLLAQPTSSILTNVLLTSGKNVINHKLGRKLQGWIPVRIRSAATFYDAQDSNQTPDQTLVIYASATVNVDIQVF